MRRTVSKNHRTAVTQVTGQQSWCSTGDRTTELNIYEELEDSASTKTVRREAHNSNIHGRAATVNL
jgi:hypothetical protein